MHGSVQEHHEIWNTPLMKMTKLLTFFSGNQYELWNSHLSRQKEEIMLLKGGKRKTKLTLKVCTPPVVFGQKLLNLVYHYSNLKGPLYNKCTTLNHKIAMVSHQRLRKHAKLKYWLLWQQCCNLYILLLKFLFWSGTSVCVLDCVIPPTAHFSSTISTPLVAR